MSCIRQCCVIVFKSVVIKYDELWIEVVTKHFLHIRKRLSFDFLMIRSNVNNMLKSPYYCYYHIISYHIIIYWAHFTACRRFYSTDIFVYLVLQISLLSFYLLRFQSSVSVFHSQRKWNESSDLWEMRIDENRSLYSAPTELQSGASSDDKQCVFMCLRRQSGGAEGAAMQRPSENSVGKRMHHRDK